MARRIAIRKKKLYIYMVRYGKSDERKLLFICIAVKNLRVLYLLNMLIGILSVATILIYTWKTFQG